MVQSYYHAEKLNPRIVMKLMII